MNSRVTPNTRTTSATRGTMILSIDFMTGAPSSGSSPFGTPGPHRGFGSWRTPSASAGVVSPSNPPPRWRLAFAGLLVLLPQRLAVRVDRADGDHRQPLRVEVLLGHVPHLLGRHRLDLLAVLLQEVEPQPVPLGRQQLAGHRRPGREPERQAPEQVLLHVLDLLFGRRLVPQPGDLLEEPVADPQELVRE